MKKLFLILMLASGMGWADEIPKGKLIAYPEITTGPGCLNVCDVEGLCERLKSIEDRVKKLEEKEGSFKNFDTLNPQTHLPCGQERDDCVGDSK